MAEGGTGNLTIGSHDQAKANTNIDPRLIECPICLEQLRHPKSLPCLHTFCEECLNLYITKDSGTTPIVSFPCPVCRTETMPVDPKEKKENWAKQFPTNNFIIEMSKGHGSTSPTHACDPCKKRGVNNVAAKVWWKESNRFLCDTCLGKLHDVIDDDHSLINVTTGREYLPINAPTYARCPKHKKEMDLFCEDHRSVCCSTCIAVTHRKCDVVITLSEYGVTVRESTRIQVMRTSLQDVADAMKFINEEIRKQTDHLGKDRDTVMKEITDLRQKFEERLDKLQSDLTNEVTVTYKEEKEKLDGMLHKCERMYNGIQTTQSLLESDIIQKDDMQMLSVLQRGSMEIKSSEDLIAQVAETLTTVDLKLDHSDEEMLNSQLLLGRLNVTRTGRNVPDSLLLSKKPLCLAEVKQVGKFCIKTPSDQNRCRATGLVYLSNGHIVLADRGNKKVKLFKESDELVSELVLQGEPWDLCLVDNNTVAVTLRGKQIVSMIKIESSKLSLVPGADVSTRKQCDGIAYKNGRYIMTTGMAYKYEIYSIENQDSMVQLLHQPSFNPYYLACDPRSSDVIVSLFSNIVGDTVVYRLSPDGTTTELAKVGLIRQGNGVDVDMQGNVYVCGKASNNVVQISQDGNTIRELVTSSHGLRAPYTLSLHNNRFVVSNDGTDSSNYIRIFELY